MRLRRLSRPAVIVAAAALVVAGALTAADRRLASSQTVTLVAALSEEAVPLDDPGAGVWKHSAPIEVPLSAQQTVQPMGGGERTVKVRALNDGQRLYVRMEWTDDTRDDLTNDVEAFSDAAAIEYPVAQGEQVPSFCMGNPDAPVNIWQWKASWQGDVEQGRPASVEDAHPNVDVDTYPFEDEDAFYPPQAAGNVSARVNRTSPVDNLLAGSFGTLTAADDQMVQGTGDWDGGKWRVVFARDLAVSGDYSQFSQGEQTNIAFAVWDGAQQERDGIKSVSQFVTLDVSPEPAPAEGGVHFDLSVRLIVVAGLALVALGVAGGLALLARGRS